MNFTELFNPLEPQKRKALNDLVLPTVRGADKKDVHIFRSPVH